MATSISLRSTRLSLAVHHECRPNLGPGSIDQLSQRSHIRQCEVPRALRASVSDGGAPNDASPGSILRRVAHQEPISHGLVQHQDQRRNGVLDRRTTVVSRTFLWRADLDRPVLCPCALAVLVASGGTRRAVVLLRRGDEGHRGLLSVYRRSAARATAGIPSCARNR